MDYQTRAQSTPAIDEGLRQYMMSVYNYMASGLALTGLVAYMLFQATAVMGPTGEIVGLTNLGVTLYTGPMMWGCCISTSWNCDVYEFWNKRYVCF